MRARLLMALAVFGATVGLTRADEKSTALDRTELDKRIVAVVYEAAVAGTDMFNPPKNNYEGCVGLYRGTLMAVIPMLDHRPKLQAAAKKRVERSTQMGRPWDAALELRTALDEIQNEIAPPAKKDAKDKDGKDAGKDKEPKALTLWDRLGGDANVKALAQKARVNAAEKAAFIRDKKLDAAKFDQAIVAWVSANSGGPWKYNPADLKTALGGATVSDADFDAFTAAMVEQLKNAKLTEAEMTAVSKAWLDARKDFGATKN